MIKVLFVCLGNIIRSQFAHAIFDKIVQENSLEKSIFSDSAGTSDTYEGDSPDDRTLKVLKNHRIEFWSPSRKIDSSDYNTFDYILVMDHMNYKDVVSNIPQNLTSKVEIRLLREFDKLKDSLEVDDPFYGTIEDFEQTYIIIERSLNNFLNYLIKTYNLSPSVTS